MATATDTIELNTELSEGMQLQLTKVIRAKRERVYEAWTNPAVLRHWFGPGAMTVTSAELDVRTGGAYRIEIAGAAPGQVSTASGVYRRIVPNQLLQFTWNGSWRPEEESLVTVSLRDVDGGTEVTILHERVATTDGLKGYEQGWLGCMANLATLLES